MDCPLIGEAMSSYAFLAFSPGMPELIIVLVIVVLVFGVGKLPEVGRQLGAGIKNFKRELNAADVRKELDDDGTTGAQSDELPQPRDVTESR